jgi:hypothetical protein
MLLQIRTPSVSKFILAYQKDQVLPINKLSRSRQYLWTTAGDSTQVGRNQGLRDPAESRTFPAACMDAHLPMQMRPWKILYKKTYKHYLSMVLGSKFFLVFSRSWATSSRVVLRALN